MKNKPWYWYVSILVLLLAFLLSVNTDIAHFSQHKDTGVPVAFFRIIFSVDVLVFISLLLIFFYKKVGAIIFPFLVFIHFLLHNFYLSTTLFSDLMVLFLYFAIGLPLIIPLWKSFK